MIIFEFNDSFLFPKAVRRAMINHIDQSTTVIGLKNVKTMRSEFKIIWGIQQWNFLKLFLIWNFEIKGIDFTNFWLFLENRPHQTGSDQSNIFNSNNHIFSPLSFHLLIIHAFITVKYAQNIFI